MKTVKIAIILFLFSTNVILLKANSLRFMQETSEPKNLEENEDENTKLRKALFSNDLDPVPTLNKVDLAINSIYIPAKRCSGDCKEIPMEFTPASSNTTPFGIWDPSHGSPTTGTSSIWMWSRAGVGEGVNLPYNFVKGNNYCIENLIAFSRTNSNSSYANTRANILLTPSALNGSNTAYSGNPPPATPTPNQVLVNQNYLSFPADSYQGLYTHNFNASDSFNNVWYYPFSPYNDYTATMNIKSVKICLTKVDPCNYSLRIWRRVNCNMVQFYPYILLSSTLNVKALQWDFGDGTTSNDRYPAHFYANAGSYVVTLTTFVENGDGECCVKRYRIYVTVKGCSPCKNLNYSSITATNIGSMIKFEPTIPHSNDLVYDWDFSDNTSYNTREVTKSYLTGTVTLTIYNLGGKECCKKKITRRVYYNRFTNKVSLYPVFQLVAALDSKIAPEEGVLKVAYEDSFDAPQETKFEEI